MNLSFTSLTAIVDAVIIIVERYFEFKLLAEYIICGDTTWFWLTVTSILLPGVVGIAIWVAQAWKKRMKGADLSLDFVFGVAAGLIVWPLSSVIWYDMRKYFHRLLKGINIVLFTRTVFVAGYCLKEGDQVEQKLYNGIILRKALQSCLENAPQTVLQMYIIISTWGNTGNKDG